MISFILSGCQSDQANNSLTTLDTNQPSEVSAEVSMDKEYGNVLVAYFSEPESDGMDAVAGASRVTEAGEILGNTEQVATWIARSIKSDMYQIESVDDYPGDHDELVDQAEKEKAENMRPKLKASIENLENYDTIFIGYPIWWSDLPMPVYSFFEEEDFSGKTIILFSTHGGSGFANTEEIIRGLEPDATVELSSFTVSRNDVSQSQALVQEWLANFEGTK
ncbi:flavodoxin [Enterococcus termitis]